MKILIIGGTKFIGKFIAKAAQNRGYDLFFFNRAQNQAACSRTIKGDVNSLLSYKEEIKKHHFDFVVHCIAYTEQHSKDLVEIFKGTDTHIIALSSGDSYEAFQGLNRNKDFAELPLREDSPLAKQKFYWNDSNLKGGLTASYDKNLMTNTLMEANKRGEIKTTIFRLPLVYGPGDYQYPGRHGDIIKRIVDKRPFILFSTRQQCQVYTYGYIENISSAIIHALESSMVDGKIYNLGEDYSRSRRRWGELYCKVCNWKLDFHILPEELIRKDKALRDPLPQHLIMDSRLFKRETGFKPVVSLEQAIEKTFQHAVENPDVFGESPNYQNEEKLVSHYYKMLDHLHLDLES